jgi:AraC-like DNA-binding protein
LDTSICQTIADEDERGWVQTPERTKPELLGLIRPELRSRDVSVSCMVGSLANDIALPSESSAAFSILLVLQGSGRTWIDGAEPLRLAAGTAVTYWSDRHVRGQNHIEAGKPFRAVAIRLHTDYLGAVAGAVLSAVANPLVIDRSHPDKTAFLVSLPLSSALLDVARAILDCAIPAGGLREVYMHAKGLEAVALTLELLARPGPAGAQLSTSEREKIEGVRRLIELAYSEPWTIESLAKSAGLSETKLKIGFRTVTGKSVRSYLRDIRMDRAATLLAEGSTVTHAAFACGYTNLSYFSKAFFISKGIAPRHLQLRRSLV